VVTVDPLFNRYRQGNTPLKRPWTGALWSDGPAWSGQGRYLVWSDIPNNRRLRWLEDDGSVTVFRHASTFTQGGRARLRRRGCRSCPAGARRSVTLQVRISHRDWKRSSWTTVWGSRGCSRSGISTAFASPQSGVVK